MSDPINNRDRADQDTVAIIDQETMQVLIPELSIFRISPMRIATMTRFAVEDGTERSDHIVRALDEVLIDASIDSNQLDVYEVLQNIFEKSTVVTIQGKLKTFRNMILVSLPHDENTGSAFNVALTFQEWKVVQPEYGTLPPRQVANPVNSSTVSRGQQKGRAVSKDSEEGQAVKEKAKTSRLAGWLKS